MNTESTFACYICKKTFPGQSEENFEHIRNSHLSPSLFLCIPCNFGYHCKDLFQAHIQRIQCSQTYQDCHLCGNRFLNRLTLSKHLASQHKRKRTRRRKSIQNSKPMNFDDSSNRKQKEIEKVSIIETILPKTDTTETTEDPLKMNETGLLPNQDMIDEVFNLENDVALENEDDLAKRDCISLKIQNNDATEISHEITTKALEFQFDFEAKIGIKNEIKNEEKEKTKAELVEIISSILNDVLEKVTKVSKPLHKCNYCDLKFKHKSQLKSHKKGKHQKPKIEKSCKICNKSFKRLAYKKQHEKTTGHKEKLKEFYQKEIINCQFCPKTFNDKSN